MALVNLGGFEPLVQLFLGLLFGVAILLLQDADKLVGLATDPFLVVIGEFAPPLFDLASHFLPLAFKYILVHCVILSDLVDKLP